MNEQEFLDFWKTIKWPEVQPVYYRLYYNDSGEPLFYSHEDQPGKYIEVSPEQFALQSMQVQVVDGVLKQRLPLAPPKLVPSNTGTPCDPGDVSVVVSQREPHQKWKYRTHEQN